MLVVGLWEGPFCGVGAAGEFTQGTTGVVGFVDGLAGGVCGEAGAAGVCVEPGPAAWVVIGVGGPMIDAGMVFVVPGWLAAP
ncbi:MAG TPA: hypothetical protein VMQ17_18285 [Candidatus Sulfotelmatobacter sp.]|nr:hypothetical protein [Candidatus Sulfotelmatobacter sp.]